MCGADSFADGSCLPLDASSDAIGNPLLNFIVGNSAGSGAALLLSQAGVVTLSAGVDGDSPLGMGKAKPKSYRWSGSAFWTLFRMQRRAISCLRAG